MSMSLVSWVMIFRFCSSWLESSSMSVAMGHLCCIVLRMRGLAVALWPIATGAGGLVIDEHVCLRLSVASFVLIMSSLSLLMAWVIDPDAVMVGLFWL